MSIVYSIAIKISRFFEISFKNSFLFTTIFGIGKWIEQQWINSYFKGLYPSENFLSFLKKNKILSKHIFAPAIVIFVFSIFLLLSLSPISFNLIINLTITFIAFIIGAMIVPKYFLNNEPSFIEFNSRDVYSLGFCLVLVGIIFFFLSVASVGGVPLLKPSLRYGLRPMLTMPVFLMIPGIGLMAAYYLDKFKKKYISRSQVRFRFLVLICISSIFLFSLGYRTPIIAVLLMMIIIGYYGEILAVWEVVIGALLGVGIIIGIGYYRSIEELTITSSTSPLYTLQSRADFTLHVLNLLSYISGDFGLMHGKLTLSAIPGATDLGPRMTIGKLIAWRTEVTVTPTLIGPMLIDFGRVGLAIAMAILGFVLGIGYKIIEKTKDSFYIVLYALLLTYTILGVETGILDIQVLVYFLLGFLIYLANLLHNTKITK